MSENIWDIGIKALDPDGIEAKGIRGFLGKLIKTYTEENVAKAIAMVILKHPANPKAYIVGILKNTADSYTFVHNQPTQTQAIEIEQAKIRKDLGL